MTTPTPPAAARPRRRWLRRIVLASAVIIGVYALLFVYQDWRGRREWEAACAEADRLDPGWRWEDLAPKLPYIPPDRNSAERFRAARRLMPAGWPDKKQSAPLWDSIGLGHKLPALPSHRLPRETAA